MRRLSWLFAIFLPLFCAGQPAASTAQGTLSQEVYVWQRAHTVAISSAIQGHAASFHAVIVLAAEIAWKKSASVLVPQITRVSLDWSALRAAPQLGLALRINGYAGPFLRDDATAKVITRLVCDLLADAARHGARVHEFQIDFDAATSKLAGYQAWLEAVRDRIAPVPLTFTALPAWLRSPDFSALAHAIGGFVLQVHSLNRPRDANPLFALCDPVIALAAIDRAARVNVPFRVALPTYGYVLAFDASGRFAGLSAEGPAPEWRDHFLLREVRADPSELARLVSTLTTHHPATLTGLIWYRLPVAGDRFNWSWPALAAVMNGHAPAAHLRAISERGDDGHLDLALVNEGDGDFNGAVRVVARWGQARRTGADALGTFSIAAETTGSMQLAAENCVVPAGNRRVIGWLRLSPATLPLDLSLEN